MRKYIKEEYAKALIDAAYYRFSYMGERPRPEQNKGEKMIGFKKLFTLTALVGLFMVSYLVILAWNGFVLTKLWAWFVVPTFGLPVLSLPLSMGITLIVHYLTWQPDAHRSEDPHFACKVYSGKAFLAPAWTWLIGWLITLFI